MKNINKYRKAMGDNQDVEAQQPDPHQSYREGKHQINFRLFHRL